jgi:hypothetical protein
MGIASYIVVECSTGIFDLDGAIQAEMGLVYLQSVIHYSIWTAITPYMVV